MTETSGITKKKKKKKMEPLPTIDSKWLKKKSDKKEEKTILPKAKEFSSWIKKKPKEYNPTEATAHMRTKKGFWIKKKKKNYTNQ